MDTTGDDPDSDLQGEATRQLQAAAEGDPQGASRILELIYGELRSLAGQAMQSERVDHSLQATELVNAAWIKLFDGKRASFQDRQHFLAVASNAMRQVLVDHARGRLRLKRGGAWQRIDLAGAELPVESAAEDILALNEALTGLKAEAPRAAAVVELRYFGGLSVEDAATALEMSPSTVAREWRFARAWLSSNLSES